MGFIIRFYLDWLIRLMGEIEGMISSQIFEVLRLLEI